MLPTWRGKSVRLGILLLGCALVVLRGPSCHGLAQEAKTEDALTQLSRILDVNERRGLAAALQTRLETQDRIEEFLRTVVAAPIDDPELKEFYREAVVQLGRHASEQNIRVLIRSIDLVAPPLVVSEEFALGEVELFYPSTHSLIASIGPPVIPLSINEVAIGGLGRELNDKLDAKLELLAYTLLSIQRDADQGPQAAISDEMRNILIERVQATSPRSSRIELAIIDRFVELIRTVEPSIYRFPRIYDQKRHRLPPGSQILEVNSETRRLRIKPKIAYINERVKQRAANSD